MKTRLGWRWAYHLSHIPSTRSWKSTTMTNSTLLISDEDSKDTIWSHSTKPLAPPEADSDSTKDAQTDQDSTKTLVIRATPHGRTVCCEKSRLLSQSAERFYPQVEALPFQIGTPLPSPEDEGPKDLCHKVIMVCIAELSDSEDDLLERVSLGDYNSEEFDATRKNSTSISSMTWIPALWWLQLENELICDSDFDFVSDFVDVTPISVVLAFQSRWPLHIEKGGK